MEIRDLDSRNGLFVDGARVPKASLQQGSLLRIGEWVGVVNSADAMSPLCCPTEHLPACFARPRATGSRESGPIVAGLDMATMLSVSGMSGSWPNSGRGRGSRRGGLRPHVVASHRLPARSGRVDS